MVTELNGSIRYSPVVKVQLAGLQTGLSIFPNPVSGSKVSVQFTGVKEVYTVRIYAASGKIIQSTNWEHPGGMMTKVLDLPSGLPAGQYFMEMSSRSAQYRKTLILQ